MPVHRRLFPCLPFSLPRIAEPGRVICALCSVPVLLALFGPVLAAGPAVVSSLPPEFEIGVPLDSNLTIRFAAPLDPATVIPTNALVTGSLRGRYPVSVAWSAGFNEIVIDPQLDFLPGERIRLVLGEGLEDTGGLPLDRGFSYEFTAWSAPMPDGQFTATGDTWPIGGIAFNLTVADLDGDGLPEAVFSNVVPDSLTILTPDGADGWSLLAQLPTDILPRHVAVGDVTGDGLSDLVYVVGTNRIEVYQNQGGGSFSGPVGYATGQTPYGVFLGDLDADGDLDAATANFNGHSVSVLLNQGNGTFAPFADYSAGNGADSPRWVDGSDFDGDGDIDLACCNGYSFDVSILINDGDGVFTTLPARPGVGDSPNFLEARDLDGDRRVDLVTVNAGPGSISFLKGNGDGSFQAAVDFLVNSTLPYGLQVADLEGDGDLDVVVPLRAVNGWRAMVNDGLGSFSLGPLHLGGNHCHTVGVADWDRDGDLDVVAGFAISRDMFHYVQDAPPVVVCTIPLANATGVPVDSPVDIWFNTTLSPESLVDDGFRVEGSQSGLHVVDFAWDAMGRRVTLSPAEPFVPGEIVGVTVTGDGVVNSETGLEHEGFTFEFLAEGGVSAATFAGNSIALPGTDPVDIVAADFDEDGLSDLAVANFLSGDVTILATSGDGLPQVTGTIPVELGPIALWAGDIDADGHVDLAAANVTSASISLLFGDGAGGFPSGSVLSGDGGPFALIGADLDQDGDADLVVAEIDPDGVRIHWNDGMGQFPTSDVLTVLGVPLDLAIADLDRDGDLDIVSVDSGNNRIEVFLRIEGTTFENGGSYGTGNTPVSVFPWDTNGDNWIDLVSADYGNGGISVLENTGVGAAFAPAFNLPSDDLPHGIWAADLNGDGELDLVTANSGASDVSVFRNLGGGTFEEPISIPTGTTPYAVVGGDWNADGLVDLATVNRTSGDLSLLLNGVVTDAGPAVPGAPLATGIREVGPNPFRERATIRFALSRPGRVEIRVYDVRGRTIAPLFEGALPGGFHTTTWDGRDRAGRRVAAGVYFLRMDTENRAWARKILRVH